MKKKIVTLMLSLTMAAGLLSGCTSSSTSGNASDTGAAVQTAENMEEAVAAASSAEDSGLTAEEQEAVDAGLINLDGTLPIITDPEAFEAKYGKISALIVNSADRVVPVEDLEMCKVWFEDTGIEFEWQAIPSEGA